MGLNWRKEKTFVIDFIVKLHCLIVPASEDGKEYEIRFENFAAEDSTKFPTWILKFETSQKKEKNPAYP